MSLLFKSYFDVLFGFLPESSRAALQLPAPRVTGLLLLWSLLFYRNLLFTQFNDGFVLRAGYAKWNADDAKGRKAQAAGKIEFAIETYLAFEAWPEAGHFHFGALECDDVIGDGCFDIYLGEIGVADTVFACFLTYRAEEFKTVHFTFFTDSTPAPLSEGYRGCMSAPSLPPSV